MSANQIQCAACGAAISLEPDGRLPAQCPACGELLVYDDEEEVQPPPDPQPVQIDEMEEVRIRRIVRERRAMVRTVGYHLVAVLACVIFAIRLAVRFFTIDSATQKIGYGAATILLLWIGLDRRRAISPAQGQDLPDHPHRTHHAAGFYRSL